jgi:hypothetical protein
VRALQRRAAATGGLISSATFTVFFANFAVLLRDLGGNGFHGAGRTLLNRKDRQEFAKDAKKGA